MSEYVIQGGKPLYGTVEVAGSKNSSLAILSSVVLTPGRVVLTNMPTLRDTKIKAHLLSLFGATVDWIGDTMIIDSSNIHLGDAPEDLVREIRTSFYMLGPLLGRLKRVAIPAPGGCNIGARPVDLHLKGLELLGAKVSLEHGIYRAECDKLIGTEIYLDFPSAGATQHLMATAVLAEGVTTITNAALEPEVVHLADFLNSLSDEKVVEGAGTSTIEIYGGRKLRDATYRIPPDRIQAGTYLLAGVITGGKVRVENILPETQNALVNKLREAGADVNDEDSNAVEAGASKRLMGTKVITMPYPGFPTDIQQPMAAVLALAQGESKIEESIYESRTGHVAELNRMGAKLESSGRLVTIHGVNKLSGAVVKASDLRAGAALILAGLAAKGETTVQNVHFVERGYEGIIDNLAALGADIERIGPPEELPLSNNLR